MAGISGSSRSGSKSTLKLGVVLLSLVLVPHLTSSAQEPTGPMPPVPPSANTNKPAPGDTHVIVPVGTRIPLVLTRSLNSHAVHAGDAVFAQISAPVLIGDQLAVPAGTFVRGKVERLTRTGTRADLYMRSASLVMGSSVVDLGGPVKMQSDEWTAYNNPGRASSAAIILVPIVALPLGALVGHATDGKTTTYVGGTPFTTQSHKGLVIGTSVGFGAGLATSFALMARSHSFYLEEGTPLEMTLQTPVAISSAQISEAEHSVVPVQVTHPSRTWRGLGNPPLGGPGNPPGGPGSCSAGQEWCMGECKSSIDFVNDSSNCGRCGNRCSFNESCTGGFCSCAAGYSSCMGSCASDSSFISDNNNCGSCGHSCSIGESCTGGMCTKQP